MLDPLEPYGLRTARRRPELSIPGSPERCVSRTVIEDTSGRLWLLEQLAAKQTPRRAAIAEALHALQKRFPGPARPTIPAYRQTREGGFLAEIAGLSWQLSPFVLSDPLPRPDYLDHAERGEALAHWMIALGEAAEHLPVATLRALRPDRSGLPSLPAYVADLLETTRRREPGVRALLDALLPRLEPGLHRAAVLPERPQHGDLHPLNVLWRGREVAAVIDWEFLGVRPECWDLANLLGCLGFEHPRGLTGSLALTLTRRLRKSGYLSPGTWAALPEFTAVLRTAWLSEWLRKGERDLLDMELEYMALLLDRADELREAWGRGPETGRDAEGAI